MITDPGIKTDAPNDILCVQVLHLGIRIQLIEIADPESQVCVGKKLDCLCLRKAHEQGIDLRLERAFLQQSGELFRFCPGAGIAAHDDPAGIKIVIKSLRLSEELRTEEDIVHFKLRPH